MSYQKTVAGIVSAFVIASVSPCQQISPSDPPQPGVAQETPDKTPPPPESKRLLWVIPNYRTSPTLENYAPLTASEKFKIASQDAFDRGTVALAAAFGGGGRLTNSNRSFGRRRGVAGFARYFGRVLWQLADRRLYDRGSLPYSSSPGSSLLSTRRWNWVVQAPLCGGPDLLDSYRFGRHAVQLFRSDRELNRGRNLERLLRGQPNGLQRRVQPRCAAWGRHGCQRSERVLAGPGTEIQTEAPVGRRPQVGLTNPAPAGWCCPIPPFWYARPHRWR